MWFCIVLVFCLMSYVNCEEPTSCSQFQYVDKLLEKMIRMEMKVENFDKSITATNADVLATLEELKNFDKSITATNHDVLTALEDMKREREEYRNDIMQMKKDMLDSIKKEETPTVVFKARSVKDLNPKTGQTMIFTGNMLNYGDGYDNMTGIFTAPVSGTYLFTFQLCVKVQQPMYYGLVYNNIVHTSGRFYDTDAQMCYTADGMLLLNAGHKVWIKCLAGSSSSNILYEQSTTTYNFWNTFSGMLIHK